MKRNLIIILLILISCSVFSQDKLLIYISNLQVEEFDIASIDSILIIEDQLIIYQVNNLPIGFHKFFIDSIKIDGIGDYDPVLDNIFLPTASKKIITNDVEGIPVWQLTDGSSECAAPYHEHQAFTSDDKYIVFRMKHDDEWRLYRSELRTGLISLLSNRPLISPAGDTKVPTFSGNSDAGLYTIMPNGKEVAFLAGAKNERKLYAVNVETREERVLFNVFTEINNQFGSKHDDFQFTASFTNDGKYTLIMSNYKTDDRSEFFRVNLETLEIEKVATGPYKSTHPVIHPANPDILYYVPPENQPVTARNYVLKISGNTLNNYTVPVTGTPSSLICQIKGNSDDVKPFLSSTVLGGASYRATHETWSYDGTKMFYFRKSGVGICSSDFDEETLSLSSANVHRTISNAGHGVANRDMNYFVSDQQRNGTNSLYLINLQTNTQTTICNPNASNSNGNYQYEHVHPSFSSSGNYIIYSSDRYSSGKYQVFVVPLENY